MMSCSNGRSTVSVCNGCRGRSLMKPLTLVFPPGAVFRVRNFSIALRSSSAHSRPFFFRGDALAGVQAALPDLVVDLLVARELDVEARRRLEAGAEQAAQVGGPHP